MPNSIGPSGLTIASLSELVTNLSASTVAIFGADINLDPNSPDGQLLGIFAQTIEDALQLIQQVNAFIDPDQAVGVILDARCAINGIQRQAGTYTIQNITMVFSGACSLPGLDQSALPVYTVQDNAGTQWELITSQTVSGAGTNVYAFQAVQPGQIQSLPNTITIPVTVVVGVSTVNNPTTFTTLGINEETDAALKIRRQQSVANGSQGYLAGLLGSLLNISGVTTAIVLENNTGTTNADGITGHSIWVIVGGSGASNLIAQAIYTKRNAGCGMVGTQTYNITQADGSIFTIKWDTVTTVALFVTATLSAIDGVTPPNIAAIQTSLLTSLAPPVYGTVNINELGTLIQKADPNSLVTSPGFCLTHNGTFTNTLTPATKNKQFVVSSADIILLPIVLTAPPAVTAVNGYSATVTSASASAGAKYTNNSLTFTVLSTISSATTLLLSGPGAPLASGTFTKSSGTGDSIITFSAVTGDIVTVAVPATASGPTITFGALGGYGTMSFSVQSGAGSINSSSGVYTPSTAGSDVVLVTDANSNTAIALVTVT